MIGACVESLAGQTEIGEILVINDQSTDQTANVVKKEMEKIPKLRLLVTNGPPTGWVGKNYAAWIGARAAKGEWLLFTDADAVHSGGSAAKALAIAGGENSAVVSFSPEQVMEMWYEKALIPYVYCRLADKFSYAEVNDPAKPAAGANGQFLMFRRETYDAIGGHEYVAGEVLEDVALAQRSKNAGYRIWFGSGKGVVRVRMYRSFAAMWEGWKKNLYPLMGGSRAALTREFARAVTPPAALLVVVSAGFLSSVSPMAGFGVAVICALILAAFDGNELKQCGFAPRLALYGIPGRLLFGGVLVASYLSHRRGRVEWKGRAYPVGTPGASK